MRRDIAYTIILHLAVFLSLTGCNADTPSDPGCDGGVIDILMPSRAGVGEETATNATFRAVVFNANSGVFLDTGTYFKKNDTDDILTPAEINYDDENNLISSISDNREKALLKALDNADIYLVSPACKFNTDYGCLVVNPQKPLYVSSKQNHRNLRHYAPIDFSGNPLTPRRSRLIINFYKLSESSTSSTVTIDDVVLNNAGTSKEALYHLPTNRVLTDADHKMRSITLQVPEKANDITVDGKTFTQMATTGEIYVMSATYNPYNLTSSLCSDYIYLDFKVHQNAGTLPESLLLTDKQFDTLAPGYEYSYRVLLSSEIIQLTVAVSPWNRILNSTGISNDFVNEYNLGTWAINGWGEGTSGDSGIGSIDNPKN